MASSNFLYLHIKCAQSAPNGTAQVRIGSHNVRFAVLPGKWYTNIKISCDEPVELVDAHPDHVEIVICENRMYHPDQIAFDERYQIQSHSLQGEEVFYTSVGNDIDPDSILITFAGVSSFDNVNYRLSALTSVQERIKSKALIIAFQDKVGVFGNYMFRTDNGYPIRAIVTSLIRGLMDRYGLAEERIIFYGNSKGGTVAIDYINTFPDSTFFIDIPQLDLFNYKSQNDLMRLTTGVEARNYYKFADYLSSLVAPNVYYSFAERDFDAARGHPMRDFAGIRVAMLKDMAHAGAAMELVKRQFAKIIGIIGRKAPSFRGAIGASVTIQDGKLRFRRLLPAFQSELDMKNLYAEVKFQAGDTEFSVSLNKTLREKGVVVFWARPFECGKHLPDGSYDLFLVLYFRYREIVYPLRYRLIVEGGIANLKEMAEVA